MFSTMATPTTTPGDDAIAKAKVSHPQKGKRFRVLGKGEGDFCVYQIAPADSQLPQGCLIPLPDVPRSTSLAEAMKWIKNESHDLLAGKQIMVFCAHEIMTVSVVNQPRITIDKKPKVQVAGPVAETENAPT